MSNFLNTRQTAQLIKSLQLLVILFMVSVGARAVLMPNVGAFPKSPMMFALAMVFVVLVLLPWHRWLRSARGLVALNALILMLFSAIALATTWRTGTAGWWQYPLVACVWSIAFVSLEQKKPTAAVWYPSRTQIVVAAFFVMWLAGQWWLARSGHGADSAFANEMIRVFAVTVFTVVCTVICLKAYLYELPWDRVREAVSSALLAALSIFLLLVVFLYDSLANRSESIASHTYFVAAWLASAAVLTLTLWRGMSRSMAWLTLGIFIVWTAASAPQLGSFAAINISAAVVAWLFLLPRRLWLLAALGSSAFVFRLFAVEGIDTQKVLLNTICGGAVFAWFLWLTRSMNPEARPQQRLSAGAEAPFALDFRQRILVGGCFGVTLLAPVVVLMVEDHPSPGLYQALVLSSLLALVAFYVLGRLILGGEAIKQYERIFEQQTAILNRAHSALQMFDTDGRMLWSNPAAKKLLALSQDETAALNLFESPAYLGAGLHELARQVLHDGQAQSTNEQVADALGEPRHLRHTIEKIQIAGTEKILLQTDDQTQVNRLREIAQAEAHERALKAEALERALAQEQAVRVTLDELRLEQQTILDAAVFGLAHARNRRWVWVNKEFARMLGYEVKDLIGQPTRQLYFDEHSFKEATTLALKQAEAGHDVIELELRLVHKDGTPRLISIRGRMFDAEHFDVIFSYRDVTDERAAAREMADALEAAQAGERAKDEFLSVMSHEVRTPLNGIMGSLQVAQLEEGLRPSTLALLDSAMASSEMLLQLLNDMLDASAISAGKLHVQPGQGPLNALIDSVRQLAAGLKVPQGVQLHLALPEEGDKHLMMDELRVRQIILNLMSNALKFTPQGSVNVSLDLQEHDAQAMRLIIRVQDTGIGMDDEAQGRVFEPFTQADMSTRRLYGGTGLGLAIVKALVEKMNGSISLRSALGVGSTFVVEIPVVACGLAGEVKAANADVGPSSNGAPPQLPMGGVGSEGIADEPAHVHADARSAQGVAVPVGTGELAGVHVLVVEDEPSNRKVHEILLRGAGANVSLASSGEEALGLLQGQGAPVDLVLLDLQMPGMDGFEVARAIRKMGSPLVDVPIVALSGNVMSKEPERVLAVGMNGFLSKPVLRASLIDEIRRVLPQSPS